MRLLRVAVERLLLLIFGMARRAFLLQGVAAGCAWISALALVRANPPAWLRGAMTSTLLLSGAFLVAGLLLVAVRRWRVPGAQIRIEAATPWPALLVLSLLASTILAGVAGSGLPSLWTALADWLQAAALRDESASGG